MRFLLSSLAFFLLVVQFVCAQTSVYDVVSARTELSTLKSVLDLAPYAAIKTALSSTTATLTLFAPSNKAFSDASSAINTTNVAQTSALLFYHVLGAKVASTELPLGLTKATTLLTDANFINYGPNVAAKVLVTKTASAVSVNFGLPSNAATVTVADLTGGASVVHIVDKVFLLPESVSATAAKAGLTSLLSALTSAQLAAAVDNAAGVTIFAPTNDAFTNAQALERIRAVPTTLRTHVLPGLVYSSDLPANANRGLPTLSGLNVTVRITGEEATVNYVKIGSVVNVITKNGVVHVIDSVIGIPDQRNSIVQNVLVVDALSTLAAVVTDARYKPVLDALSGLSTGTVFAPTNEAFATLNPDLSQVSAVTSVLQYHVVGRAILSSATPAGQQFVNTILSAPFRGTGALAPVSLVRGATADALSLNFGIPGSAADTAGARIVDIRCSNGVVHVVDKVLQPPSVPSVVAGKAGLTTLVSELTKANLVSTVDNAANITIFAPANAGFSAANLLDNALSSVLQWHVFPGTFSASDLISLNGRNIVSLNGRAYPVRVQGNTVLIGSARVTVANALTRNGLVHVIDRVIGTPSSLNTIVENAQSVPLLSTLVTVLTDARYKPVLDALSALTTGTVFAPTNAAFAAAGVDVNNVELVTAVLQYHVLSTTVPSADLRALQFPATLLTNAKYVNLGGQGQVLAVSKDASSVRVSFGLPTAAQTATVAVADVFASNGVVHVVDKVLIPPASVADTLTAAGLTRLSGALIPAGLLSTVDSTARLTIFAPSDAAFASAALGNTSLSDVLRYHVVANSQLYSTALSDGATVTTLQGARLTVRVNSNGVFVNDARVTTANVLTRNAVVHVIDKVLVPQSSAAFALQPSALSALFLLALASIALFTGRF